MLIEEIRKDISRLPKGSISEKHINGKTYYYQRWREDGQLREKYVPYGSLDTIREGIRERKELETELKAMTQKRTIDDYLFSSAIRIGDELKAFTSSVMRMRKRSLFSGLQEFIYGDYPDKVLILYGLRRTGKTTMIRQLISEMTEADFSKTAYMQILPSCTLADISRDLHQLEKNGYKYVFIDEVTLLSDFIEGAALFSDIFASSGMKIVLSGTDSLGFMFAEDDELYDRCYMIHTTFIPYREFSYVLGIDSIDEYIRYGGTMSISGYDYNHGLVFRTKSSTDEYIDTAIARNIQHSLIGYQNGNHFRALEELFQKDELTSAINRVVEDMNHRFTIEVLTRDFISSDLSLSSKNLIKDRSNPSSILEEIDIKAVTERLRKMLEIRNSDEQTVEISDIHTREIKEYLEILDLIEEIDVVDIEGVKRKRIIFTQPGLRYAQVESLIKSLIEDNEMKQLSLIERKSVLEKIRNEVKGRMLEDIILLESKHAFPDCSVFVLQFAIGEFDMVIADSENCTCRIFEIKHSKEIHPSQYKHLIEPEKCRLTEHRFGTITGKYILYRGAETVIDDIHYVNSEEYLKSLHN